MRKKQAGRKEPRSDCLSTPPAIGSPACIGLPSSKNACARFTGMPSAALAKEGLPFSHPVRAWFTGMSLSVLRQKRLHVYK